MTDLINCHPNWVDTVVAEMMMLGSFEHLSPVRRMCPLGNTFVFTVINASRTIYGTIKRKS